MLDYSYYVPQSAKLEIYLINIKIIKFTTIANFMAIQIAIIENIRKIKDPKINLNLKSLSSKFISLLNFISRKIFSKDYQRNLLFIIKFL